MVHLSKNIYTDKGEPVYDIEITTNRPDAMSAYGVAREASVILPRFGIAAKLIDDPYLLEKKHLRPTEEKPIHIETDFARRILYFVFLYFCINATRSMNCLMFLTPIFPTYKIRDTIYKILFNTHESKSRCTAVACMLNAVCVFILVAPAFLALS